MRNLLISAIMLALAVLPVTARTWTLEECIAHAKEQNIDLKQRRLSVKQQQLTLDNAKKARLPEVSAGSSQTVGVRPFRKSGAMVNGEQVMNTSSKFSYTGNYNISASMPIYDGGKIKNNTRLAEIDTQIAELSVQQSELTIEESIVQLYVQILYSLETIKQDEEQIKLSQTQVDRAHEVYKAGLMSHVQVVQLESQLASDKYQLVADETQLANYKLQLKQLLELEGDEEIDIALPDLSADVLAPLPTKQDVFSAALMLRPEIKAQQLAMDRSDVNVAIAKAGLKPSINASAGISTASMTNNGNMLEQLYRQLNNSVGLSFTLPVYDHGKTRNAISLAQLQKQSAELDLENNRKALWKAIEGYWLEATSAQQRYVAAVEKVKYARESYELTSEQFRLGIKNIIELQTDLTNLSQANQQMLQAKYMELLNAALLRHYQGETIKL